jgi:transcriptional regulator with GAF, ATPase, and Fis domain
MNIALMRPAVPLNEPWREFLVGNSPELPQVVEIIRLVANRRCTVLISGETGTGKEMVARAIHVASDWACKPTVAGELWGHPAESD